MGCVLPSFFIVLALALIYQKHRELALMQGILKGLRPAVVAMIASAGLSLLVLAFWNGQSVFQHFSAVDGISVSIFLVSLAVLRFKRVDPMLVISGAGLIGLIAYSFA